MTPSGTPTTTSYTYDTTQVDRLTNFGGKAITYDALGNVKTYDGWTYTWTRGRLTKMSKGNRTSGTYAYNFTYNGYGQRISKTYSFTPPLIGTVETGTVLSYTQEFRYDNSGRLVYQKKTGTRQGQSGFTEEITFLYDESSIIGMLYFNGASTVTYYFDRNILGDVIRIYNPGGGVVAKYTYDAYGNCNIASGTTSFAVADANPIRYHGYYYDSDTRLYYLNARYYRPEWRRFISPDSAEYIDSENPNGLNLYAYCGNDPVNCADPSGHEALPNWLKWVIGGVAFVGAVALTVLSGGSLAPVFIGMASSIVVGGLIEGTISAANGGDFWQGFWNGAADGAMSGGIFALLGASVSFVKHWGLIRSRGVVIGKGMGRVEFFADQAALSKYSPMKGYNLIKGNGKIKWRVKLADTLSVAHNKSWIKRVMRLNKPIYDIGLGGAVEAGAWYGMELEQVANYALHLGYFI